MRRCLLAVWLAAALWPPAAAAGAASHAVILLYHRISDSGPDSTRVSPSRFVAHLDLIRARGYEVIPLAELLRGVYGGSDLPEKALAITFDDAYRSVGEVASPMLREREMPFTVFVATNVVDAGAGAFLDWPALQAMADEGFATFGAHSLSHAHLESLGHDEGKGDREREIDGSVRRLRSQLADAALNVFAYPYGEYSRATESMLAARDLYGLAQQSGAVGPSTPVTRIPRFPLYTGGDDDERLLTALAARPLPMGREEATEVFFAPGEQPAGQWRLRPADGAYRREAMRCYASSGQVLEQQWADDALLVSLPAMQPGRNKVNCTAPAVSGNGYFWHSRLWLIADEDGRWLRE